MSTAPFIALALLSLGAHTSQHCGDVQQMNGNSHTACTCAPADSCSLCVQHISQGCNRMHTHKSFIPVRPCSFCGLQINGEANVAVIREASAAGVPRCAFISVHDYGFPGV